MQMNMSEGIGASRNRWQGVPSGRSWAAVCRVRMGTGLALALAITSSGCAASQGQQVRTAAAEAFDCQVPKLRVTDAEKGVYLVEGCGHAGTFYCSEKSSLQTHCIRVTDPHQVAARSNLADALASEGRSAREVPKGTDRKLEGPADQSVSAKQPSPAAQAASRSQSSK